MLLGGFSIIFGGIPLNFEDMKNIIMGISKYKYVQYCIIHYQGDVGSSKEPEWFINDENKSPVCEITSRVM